MRIKKLRRKLRNKKWVEGQYDYWTRASERWDNFRKFECSSFFVGSLRAERNQRLYDQKVPRIDRHVRFLRKVLDSY